MNEQNNSFPFGEMADADGLDIEKIFGGGNSVPEDINPFDQPQPQPQQNKETEPEKHAEDVPAEGSAAAEQKEEPRKAKKEDAPAAAEPALENPLEAAFFQKTAENARTGLFEKPPVFLHKSAREPIEDPSMTFEELHIRKSEDFADLEEGKNVSWTVEYCGIVKQIKAPKGTTIISMKESIERSREFLEALKKATDKNPDCLVKPKVTMQRKGTMAAYKGAFPTLADAMASEKVICLIPSGDGKIYELHKTEQGAFLAPKSKIIDFETIRAGFTPALPLIPMSLIGQIIAFFRSFLRENNSYEAMAIIYWDKLEKRFFAYVPRQTVTSDSIDADLADCPYDDSERYIRYADIHSHNTMYAFFSPTDDKDERGTGLYMVLGKLNDFFPDIQVRISCGGSFVELDPGTVIEGLEKAYPEAWSDMVTCVQKENDPIKRSRRHYEGDFHDVF